MKNSFRWFFRSALLVTAITISATITVLTDLSFFRATPVLYLLTLSVIITGFGLMIRNRYYLPVLRNLMLPGKLLLAPVLLLVMTAPAAVIYIYYDLSGSDYLMLLSALFTSFGAAFFLSSLVVVTLPAMASVVYLTEKKGVPGVRPLSCRLVKEVIIVSSVMAVAMVAFTLVTRFRISVIVFLLPLAAIALMIHDIIIVAHFRFRLATIIKDTPPAAAGESITEGGPVSDEGFRSVVLVADHYLEIICGRAGYLMGQAGDTYARGVITLASKTFDPALLTALKAISSGSRFRDETRNEASVVTGVIEKYYSDPVRNNDLLRLPGIQEKAAVTRGSMFGRVRPHEQDIAKLFGDASPEIRRIGLTAAGRYDMTVLRNDVLKALDSQETIREAFYVLRHFGPEVYGDIIGNAIRPGNTERENYVIIRLLDAMPLMSALPWLSSFIAGGHPGVRLKAARALCARGWSPRGKQRQRIEEALNETIHTVARLMSMQSEAAKSRNFLLSSALEHERNMNNAIIFSLLSLLAGKTAAETILPGAGDENACQPGIAAEAIALVAEPSLYKPLRALFGNHTDSDRLAELSLYYPVRSVRGHSLTSFLLTSEQNITGTWTKACALRKAATEKQGLDREQVVSYLFSNSPVLQEESSRVIRAIDPGWYSDTSYRLQEPSKSRIASVINGTMPRTAMIFEKTRFLSLCFNKIPEEKMIHLASGMHYSETYDAGSLPGVISWVVPSENGKTGLYSLAVSDIAAFVFYYPEYTDIFVDYIDSHGGVAVF
jgi:hypothetical protein